MIKDFEELINDIRDNAPQFDDLPDYLEDKGAYSIYETHNIISATIVRGDNDITLTFIKEPSVSRHYHYIRLRDKDYVMSSYVYTRILGTNKTYRILHKGDRLILN